jgi:site-specific DNA recombinase
MMARAKKGAAATRQALIRCAIYTRKSSEEGLEQAFNSLDAQREACESFIKSQKHEGWTVLPAMYDDGGLSGGTLERPALKRLLADIEARRIDTVVVYKVDRLTRSLGDFAKIVEVNTTTSMGRLTLNMLLSFAQFEREVTGERIRDKIAASKKKGMWMGGVPPLGYEAQDRTLVIKEAEAETVRHIYRRYADLGSVRELQAELAHNGILSKVRVDRYGRQTGGKPMSRGALYLLLQNQLYRGRITHKDAHYPGQHEAIVDDALWDKVQARLAANRVDREIGAGGNQPSLLMGLLYDESGARMSPSHSTKKGRRYRYYVSEGLIRGSGQAEARGLRVPAGDLEAIVCERLRQFLSDEAAVHDAIETMDLRAEDRRDAVATAGRLAADWPTLAPVIRRKILMALVQRIDLRPDIVEIAIRAGPIPALSLEEGGVPAPSLPTDPGNESLITLTVPARLRRVGMETRLLIEGDDKARAPDRNLVRLVAQAHRFREMVLRGDGKRIADLAQEAGVGDSYFSRILRLGFLAPDLTAAILRGDHPVTLTANQLSMCTRLRHAWTEQRREL